MGLLDRLFAGDNSKDLGWKILDSEDQLHDLIKRSATKTMAIFKDSTTCGISANVKDKLIHSWENSPEKVEFYYLDLLANRGISNLIASELEVPHQSPQFILIKDGKVTYNRSHFSITPDGIQQALEETNA
ncbi:bacillithiol system redox-active protein YtxJ [bacterium]|nr:bacillithiol system redox-active protein YtxJ [bacterium]